MQAEPSVSDPFPIPTTPEQPKTSNGDTQAASSPGNPGLDVTGASISSVTGEGDTLQDNKLPACTARQTLLCAALHSAVTPSQH